MFSSINITSFNNLKTGNTIVYSESIFIHGDLYIVNFIVRKGGPTYIHEEECMDTDMEYFNGEMV